MTAVKMDPAAYDAWYKSGFGSFCHRLEKDALFSLGKFHSGETVLDAGCGTGVYTEELVRMGLAVTAVDDDEEMLGYAAAFRGRGAKLIKASLDDLPFEPSSFDKVVSVCTMEFLEDPSSVLRELARVLKKDGALLVGFLNKNSPWAKLRMEKGKDASSIWHGVRFYGIPDVAGFAFKAGLRMKGFKGAVYFPPEAGGMDISELEAMEAEGRQNAPCSAAFFGVSFCESA